MASRENESQIGPYHHNGASRLAVCESLTGSASVSGSGSASSSDLRRRSSRRGGASASGTASASLELEEDRPSESSISARRSAKTQPAASSRRISAKAAQRRIERDTIRGKVTGYLDIKPSSMPSSGSEEDRKLAAKKSTIVIGQNAAKMFRSADRPTIGWSDKNKDAVLDRRAGDVNNTVLNSLSTEITNGMPFAVKARAVGFNTDYMRSVDTTGKDAHVVVQAGETKRVEFKSREPGLMAAHFHDGSGLGDQAPSQVPTKEHVVDESDYDIKWADFKPWRAKYAQHYGIAERSIKPRVVDSKKSKTGIKMMQVEKQKWDQFCQAYEKAEKLTIPRVDLANVGVTFEPLDGKPWNSSHMARFSALAKPTREQLDDFHSGGARMTVTFYPGVVHTSMGEE